MQEGEVLNDCNGDETSGGAGGSGTILNWNLKMALPRSIRGRSVWLIATETRKLGIFQILLLCLSERKDVFLRLNDHVTVLPSAQGKAGRER